ncbi:MAG: N-acetylmuramoyl-L-alanine amidase [Planctomycetota bacterium]
MKRSLQIIFFCAPILFAICSAAAESFITVEELANRLGMTCQNDVTTSRQTLTDGASQIVICPGMYDVLVNDTLVTLPARATLRYGEVVVPGSSFGLLRGHLGGQSAPPVRPTLTPTAFKVVIDPGHGGKDPGAEGCYGVREKDVTLAIGLELKRILTAKQIDVVMTREDDTFISLDDRPMIANRERADLFVSIHANAARASNAKGFEIFYVEDQGPWSAIARGLMAARIADPPPKAIGCEAVLNSVAKAIIFCALMEEYRIESYELSRSIQSSLSGRLSDDDRGTKTDHPLRVLRKGHCPGVLIEIGFVTNPSTARRLQDPAHLREIAAAIADGVMKFVEKSTVTRRFTQ